MASGTAFTKALEKHRSVFPPHVFIHLVEAGEVTGSLPEILDRLAIYYEREDELRKKNLGSHDVSRHYFIGLGSDGAHLLFVVLPMLVDNFAGFGVETPAITVAVLNGRDWMVQHWYLVIAGLVAFVMGLRFYVRTKQGRYLRDYLLLSLPVVGEMQKMVIFSRFCRTLSLLLNSGIAMIPTLGILERLMDNVVIKKKRCRGGHGRGGGAGGRGHQCPFGTA